MEEVSERENSDSAAFVPCAQPAGSGFDGFRSTPFGDRGIKIRNLVLVAIILAASVFAAAAAAQQPPKATDEEIRMSEQFASCAGLYAALAQTIGKQLPGLDDQFMQQANDALIASGYAVVKAIGPNYALRHAEDRSAVNLEKWKRIRTTGGSTPEYKAEKKICIELKPLQRDMAEKIMREYPAHNKPDILLHYILPHSGPICLSGTHGAAVTVY